MLGEDQRLDTSVLLVGGCLQLALEPSCLLFHGPRAQDRAAEAASTWGTVLGSFGHPVEGLNTEVIRTAYSHLNQPSLGDKKGSIVLGPIDILTVDGIEDILLKSLEEYKGSWNRPFLWAFDLGEVRPTIRSRCLDVWSPGQAAGSGARKQAEEIVFACLSGSATGIMDSLHDWKENRKQVIPEIAAVLASGLSMKHLKLWRKLRPLMSVDVEAYEILAGVL